MAEYNKVYASLKPELPKVIQQEQIYVYAPRSSRAGMKSINSFNITAPVAAVQYDTTDGITVTGNSSLVSEEVSGETATQNFQSEFRIPIRPGKYINIDATADNAAVEVKVDDTALALDYIKIDKTKASAIPQCTNGVVTWIPTSLNPEAWSVVQRDANGDAKFRIVNMTGFATHGSNQIIGYWNIWRDIYDEGLEVTKTTTDTGTLTTTDLEQIKAPGYKMVKYDNQLYYRYDPREAPDGTLNYIHLDGFEDGNGGYKATGKCFSVNVSTREWQVVDLEFGGSGSGSGIEQITREASNTAQSVAYDSTSGATIDYAGKTLTYTDSTTGETKTQTYPAQLSLPIKPGKYIDIGTNHDNNALEVKVDDTALALDYVKLDKTKTSAIPQNNSGVLNWLPSSISPTQYSLVQRDVNGNGRFQALYNNLLVGLDAPYMQANMNEVYRACRTSGTDQIIDKTSTDTGTIYADLLAVFTGTPNSHIIYDNQLYYRQDPTSAPTGTYNFVHIDSIEDGNGGYKATGKCFSITVSTKEWKVFDLDFGGRTRTTHNLTLIDSSTGMSIYFSLTNNRPETYEGAPVGLLAALENSTIACTVDANGKYAAGMITTDGINFKAIYGNGEEALIEQMQVSITDNLA